MTNQPIIAVRGEAVRESDPEIAMFSVTVTARDADRRTTLQLLTDRVTALRTVLDGYPTVIEKRETSRMSVLAETLEHSETVAAHVGSATTSVTVTDLDILGEMMIAVSQVEQAEVDGPHWSLRPGSPVYREARHAAMADAIARAKDYAEALGARVTGLLELSDPSSYGGSPVRVTNLSWSPQTGGGQPSIDLDPQRQEVHAQVEGRFTISEPTVLADPVD